MTQLSKSPRYLAKRKHMSTQILCVNVHRPLHVIAKKKKKNTNLKQHKCPSTGEQIKKKFNVSIQWANPQISKEQTIKTHTIWVYLKIIMQNERYQANKDTYYMIQLNIKFQKQKINLQ